MTNRCGQNETIFEDYHHAISVFFAYGINLNFPLSYQPCAGGTVPEQFIAGYAAPPKALLAPSATPANSIRCRRAPHHPPATASIITPAATVRESAEPFVANATSGAAAPAAPITSGAPHSYFCSQHSSDTWDTAPMEPNHNMDLIKKSIHTPFRAVLAGIGVQPTPLPLPCHLSKMTVDMDPDLPK